MKIAVLTQGAAHHIHFINSIKKMYADVFVVVELDKVTADFKTDHPFEKERDAYEQGVYLDQKIENVKVVNSVNDVAVLDFLKEVNPDLIFVVGTGKIRKPLIEAFEDRLLNFHGGSPEKYRGLDSHLWAIYHNDFDAIAATLHMVNEKLDDGKIVAEKKLAISPETKIYQLRYLNICACVEIALDVLKELEETKSISKRSQTGKGKYYSFMSQDLKEKCVERFEEFRHQQCV